MSQFDLNGQVAVITGSSRGIGRAVAEAFAARGAKVVVSSRTSAACESAAAEINARYGPGRAIAIPANISSKEAVSSLMHDAVVAFGPIDILVCNAASNPYYGSLDGISDEQFRKVLDNNIVSNHWLIQLALPSMRERRHGSIIVVSSIGGFRASDVLGAYAISKAADLHLVRCYALENGKHNIRVNAIAPGIVKTDFAKALWEDEAKHDATTANTPLRRLGTPEDIAGAAVYLAAPASSWMTGQVLVLDGGVTIGG